MPLSRGRKPTETKDRLSWRWWAGCALALLALGAGYSLSTRSMQREALRLRSVMSQMVQAQERMRSKGYSDSPLDFSAHLSPADYRFLRDNPHVVLLVNRERDRYEMRLGPASGDPGYFQAERSSAGGLRLSCSAEAGCEEQRWALDR